MLSPKDPINFYIFLSPNAKFHSPNEKNPALTKWPLIFRPIRPHIFGFFSHRMPKIMLSLNDPSFFEPVLSPNAPACRSAGLTPVSISNMTAPPPGKEYVFHEVCPKFHMLIKLLIGLCQEHVKNLPFHFGSCDLWALDYVTLLAGCSPNVAPQNLTKSFKSYLQNTQHVVLRCAIAIYPIYRHGKACLSIKPYEHGVQLGTLA